MSAESGLDFWLDYVDLHGGVSELTADGTLVVLPPELLVRHQRDQEELLVTAEPDVASETGATLLSAGHPLLTVAAESVLTEGDHGRVRLPRPGGRMPAAVALLEQVRGRFPIDHGRIDLVGGPRPAIRQVIRVGALVTFELSVDDQFQEHIECWVDAAERLSLPVADTEVLGGLLADMHAERADLVVDAAVLAAAVCAADEELRRRAESRRTALSQQVDQSRAAEVGRAGEYYREMIDSLVRRRDSASMVDPANGTKHAAYESRIAAAGAERDRRLAEIHDKYLGSLTILPFRLQVIGVPVLRLEVDIRRGERRYPLVLDWLTPTRSFAPIRCPHCGSTAGLVAGKVRVGCCRCLPKAAEPALRLVPPSDAASSRPTPSIPKPPAPPLSAPSSPPPRPIPQFKLTGGGRLPGHLSAAKMAGLETKLVTQFWELLAQGDPGVRRILAPHSPADALVRLWGVSGVLPAVRLTDVRDIRDVGWSPGRSLRGSPFRLTGGAVTGRGGGEHPFHLCWHIEQGRALLDEVIPSSGAYWPRLPDHPFLRRPRGGDGLFPHPVMQPSDGDALPTPPKSADAVADLLVRRTLPHRGFPLTLRALASWGRLPDSGELLAGPGATVIAASLEKMISYRAGHAGASYADVAAAHKVGVAEMKAVSAVLQRQLGLSAVQPW